VRSVAKKSKLVSIVMRSMTAPVLVLGTIGIVEAQCAFDAPAKAKSMKSSLVRAYAS
jgi:hypothetical protein